MGKLLLQLIILLLLFFGVFFGLTRVDWLTLLRIEKATRTTEEKLGDLIWDMIKKSEKIVEDEQITAPVDSMLTRICRDNNLDRSTIKMHVIRKSEINAFALPDKRLLIYTGLIEDCENEAELCGVIGHELAHIQKNHVMKKLMKEIGLSVLISITTGGNAEVVSEIIRMLSSSAYDRGLEKEADLASVDYLINAEINPEPFAEFLYRMAEVTENLPKAIYWVSTHPDSEERAIAILKYIEDKEVDYRPVLSEEEWNTLKENIKESSFVY